MTLPALEQAPTRLLSVAADAPASAVGVCSSALANPEEAQSGSESLAAMGQGRGVPSSGSASAALLPPEPQSPLQTSGGLRTDQANDLVCPPVRSGVAALDSSRLRSIVTGARQTNGPRRVRWSHKERLAWHELVVVRGISA